ncbi:MAG: hypothetical protein U1C33_00210, partial [Candidatus Cloacimonadaceae bacterium]|nr:hypothetical protein [Candidatus Cloacimonadaceae bacterium]
TGISRLGDIQSLMLNPAAFTVTERSMYVNMSIKPPVTESEIGGTSRYSAPIPFGILAWGIPLGERLKFAAAYSVPKSIVYDDFSVEVAQGANLIQRYPTYYLHQFTAAMAYHHDFLSVGLNLHNQIHYFDDIIIHRTFDRLRESTYTFRPELGLLIRGEMLSFGVTFTPETKFKLDTRQIDYDSVLPMNLSSGITFVQDNRSVSLEARFDKTSAVSDDYKDRLSLHGGYGFRKGHFSYQFGAMYYPSIFEGAYLFPVNTSSNADTTMVWNEIPTGGTFGKTDQTLITAGFTYHNPKGSLSFSLVQDVAGSFPLTQVNFSIGLYLDSLKRKINPAID